MSLTLAAPPSPWIALLVSAVVIATAMRTGGLAPSGAAAALLTGIAAMAQSWGAGLFLIIWFVFATLLSRIGRRRKHELTRGVVDKGTRRDAWQVLANGGVFAFAATIGAFGGAALSMEIRTWLAIAGAAGLVAAGADTWATELGTLTGRMPLSLREWRRVPVGSSGAVTLAGTLAAAVGALLLASIAGLLQVIPSRAIWIVALAGFVGSLADTLLGAWVQARRWCPRCNIETEQPVHECGTATSLEGGAGVLTNDGVNLLCSLCGAALAMMLA